MNFEDKYIDVLQNLESTIIQVYREHPDELLNYDVEVAVKALTRFYKAEKSKREIALPTLTELREEIYSSMKKMCEWHLGRTTRFPLPTNDIDGLINGNPKTVDEIILCLKRIQKSIKYWDKLAGKQGYLTFVNQHIL